jgi:hypothetical protein
VEIGEDRKPQWLDFSRTTENTMSFWDRFILWVFLGLVDVRPLGTEAVARLFQLAFERGFLDLGSLTDASLLFLLSGSCANTPVANAARAETQTRNLHQQANLIREIFTVARLPNATPLVEIGREVDAVLRSLVWNALRDAGGSDLERSLHAVLLHLYPHIPFNERDNLVLRCLRLGLNRYYAIPAGTEEFPSILFRELIRQFGNVLWIIPPEQGQAPSLGAHANPEQAFLARCRSLLSPPDRLFLFMHFFGGLSATQMSRCLCVVDNIWTPDHVVAHLLRLWDEILA